MSNVRRILCAVSFLALLAGALPAWAAPPAQAGAIRYGQTVSGEITDEAFEQSWVFKGAAGDVITIAVTSNDENYLDATIKLQSGDGAVLVEVDDVFGLDPFYVTRLESSGNYTITVGRAGGADGSSTGGYDLTLDRATLIALAAPATLSLAEGESATHVAIEGEEGQQVTLAYEVSAGDARPDISAAYFAYDEWFEQTRYNELLSLTGESISKASINLELPVTGVYLIVVERSWLDWGDTAGEFVVALSPAR